MSCQARPKGKIGQDHQYQGLSKDAPGNVTMLLGPHGTRHFNLRSTISKTVRKTIGKNSFKPHKIAKSVEKV